MASDESTWISRETTLDHSTGAGSRARAEKVPALTVIAHPSSDRIGDRVLLTEVITGRPVRLSRQEPGFDAEAGSGRPSRPLGVRSLSRTPIELRGTADGGLELRRGPSRTRISVDGKPLEASFKILPSALEAGVVIHCGRELALLAHRHPAVAEVSSDLGLIGRSAAIDELRRSLEQVAATEVPVLIRGATGVGKELVAQGIHRLSSRRSGPMVAVNLGALSPSLAVAELFGARKGAFTGADRRRTGYFEQADGGTLFLDELGEASPELQVALLRVLETGEITPVGESVSRRVDVRVVAATDADLDDRVAAGEFRAPLFHRLAGYELDVPPLVKRRDDICRLLMEFLRREHPGNDVPSLDPILAARCCRYHWPGNVRELRNVARRLVIDSRSEDRWRISSGLDALLPPWPPEPESATVSSSVRRRPSDLSVDELRRALQDSRFDIKAAAERLGIARSSLYGLISRARELRSPAEITADEIRSAFEKQSGDLDAMVEELELSEPALRRRLGELGLL